MNSGPYAPPPSDAPPPSEPQGVPGEPQPAPEGPAPAYYPPPAEAAGPPPRPPRSMGPLIAGIVIVVVLIAAIGGYVVGGFAFAQTRLNSAHTAYNKVVDHENSLTDTVNSAQSQLKALDVSSTSTSSSIQTFKTAWSGVISKSQAAQSQIDTDDASLASADSGLHDNSWLTVLSRSELDKYSAKIGHQRKALATAKVLAADYIQIGNFYEAFADVALDFDTLGAKLEASDLSGAAAADEKLKTDAAKAISLDKAPGLPADMDTLLHDITNMATDFTNLINAAAQHNDTAFNTAEKALQADAAKVEAFDFNKASDAIDAFYKPLIDTYNSEIDKANAG
jgi:hypothetical protein